MKKRILFLGLFGVLALVGVLSASAGPPAWAGDAIEVPHTATLNSGGSADVNSISCPTPGNCAAGGHYLDGSGHSQAFVVNDRNWTWHNALNVLASSSLNSGGNATVFSVSCASPGKCAAGGQYVDGSGHSEAFVADETSGGWGTAINVLASSSLNSGGDAAVFSVSCATPGYCAAGGWYKDGSGQYQAFVVDETGGSWGLAEPVPGTATPNVSGEAVWSVSCPAPGNCTAGGDYGHYVVDASGSPHEQPFVVDETNGSWGFAKPVPGMSVLNTGGYAELYSVSCATPGNCTAGGSYSSPGGGNHAFVADETTGNWGTAIEVPGTKELNTGGDAVVLSVSCAAASSCTAGGTYGDAYSEAYVQVFVADKKPGSGWGDAIQVPGTGTLNHNSAYLSSVSCATPGNCAAGGYYGEDANHHHAFVALETAGVWGDAIDVPGIAALDTGALSGVQSVSCAASDWCNAGGYYSDDPDTQAFVLGRGVRSLNLTTTNCDGTYTGTGRVVFVPSGATCWLLPDSHITRNVTVKPGGTLRATGLKLDGNLTVLGSASVCGSKIGGNVQATGGSFALGGPTCAGNKISGSVVVHHDAHNVWVWGNTIKNGHSVTVKFGRGPIDSIVRNIVSGNLLVAHSGPPVEVSRNHAANARCVGNAGQKGSANVAKRTNTCPR